MKNLSEMRSVFLIVKKDGSIFLGLGVYEIDKQIDEYDEYEKILIEEITVVIEEQFPFLEKIKKWILIISTQKSHKKYSI